ncbi:MAG TPA: BON domain-containing protein [Pyrinomonadaceae bacterium]|jgi:osmotically-inducible protein OsmY
MRLFTGIITLALLALSFSACSETATNNANSANANANANANTAAANANTNANANTSAKRAPTRADYEKNKQTYAEEAKSLGRKIGAGLDDGWLWTKTRFDLAAADDLKDSTINVDVENGVVTLSGTVDNPEQRAKAETIAKSVEGVKSVKNQLKTTSKTNAGAAANANQKKGAPKKY